MSGDEVGRLLDNYQVFWDHRKPYQKICIHKNYFAGGTNCTIVESDKMKQSKLSKPSMVQLVLDFVTTYMRTVAYFTTMKTPVNMPHLVVIQDREGSVPNTKLSL